MISGKIEKLEGKQKMAKMFFIISKKKGYVTAQHETRQLCQTHIRNAQIMFGNDPDDSIIAEGAKERDSILKQLKKG